MENTYAIIDNTLFDDVVKEFFKRYGLPEIQRKFSVYAYDKKGNEFHINFIEQRCDIKYISHPKKTGDTTQPVFVENKNLKRLFESTRNLGYTKANIGFVLSHKFDCGKNLKVSLSQDTFADNISEIKYCDSDDKDFQEVKNVFDKFKIELIDSHKLQKYIDKKHHKTELVYDKFGCLNPKIKKYGELVGIDLMSDTKTLRNRLKKFSNNYSFYEDSFQKLTCIDISGVKFAAKNKDCFKPVSIIIPCYNSNDTILKSLFSIQSQDLTREQKKSIDVVLVDDGSDEPVFKTVKKFLNEFDFQINVIRLEKNKGLSTARNIGIFSSKYDHLILMDSDILLPKNYLLEHSIRNQLLPNAVFVSLKKNINNNSEMADLQLIKSGLESPVIIDDLRISKSIKQNQLGIYTSPESADIEILNDTDYFKDFGYGRTIGIFDLPAMVIGHNMSLRRKTLDKTKYFSNHFTGWGMEDAYFGARLIANGCFVIPVLSSNVYHINHSPRSGSEGTKTREFKKNIDIYNMLLDQEYQE